MCRRRIWVSTGGQKSTNKIRTYLNRCKFLHISAHILCFRCSEDGEEIAAFHLDISVRLTQLDLSNVKFLFHFLKKVRVKKFPPSFSIDEGSSTDPKKSLKCEVFSVRLKFFWIKHFSFDSFVSIIHDNNELFRSVWKIFIHSGVNLNLVSMMILDC